ncbi:MAG: hypothetical protein AB2807_08445, partial [Candidatus Sedimenticola endophacoides]
MPGRSSVSTPNNHREYITGGRFHARRWDRANNRITRRIIPRQRKADQECRYLVKDFGTSQSPKSTRQRDSRYCPD